MLSSSLGLTLVFSQFQVLLSHLWKFKKKEEEGREIKRERKEEGIKKERRKTSQTVQFNKPGEED